MSFRRYARNHQSTPWTLEALRKLWNQEKHEVAPWWRENSKEAYSSGIADLVQALSNWRNSKSGKRKGGKVGFPKFRSRRKDKLRVRFTTGAMRFMDDRRTIVLPTIGALRSKENTRRVQRYLAKGDARILNATLSERWGRLFVSCQLAVRTKTINKAPKKHDKAGVDLGLRSLATVVDDAGTITVFPNPAPLRATLVERSMGRRAFRRSVADAGLGAFRPTLTYKAQNAGTKVVVVDRFFPSSQIHHDCGGKLMGKKLAKRLTCEKCSLEVDRDENAASNICDWPVASSGLVETSALFVPGPILGTGDSSDDGLTHHLERACKTSSNTGSARRGKNDPKAGEHGALGKNLVKGASNG